MCGITAASTREFDDAFELPFRVNVRLCFTRVRCFTVSEKNLNVSLCNMQAQLHVVFGTDFFKQKVKAEPRSYMGGTCEAKACLCG